MVLILAAAADGGSSVWSARRGAADGLYGSGNDVQIRCVLLFGSELSLVVVQIIFIEWINKLTINKG